MRLLVQLNQSGQPGIVIIFKKEKGSVHLRRYHRSPSESLNYKIIRPPLNTAVEADAVVFKQTERDIVKRSGEIPSNRADAIE
ncbi:hypothetical protein ES703_94143 [subsurface metagenome]